VSGGPRVSIVTPFLNAGRFIRESIESVLAQTDGRWELLLVDDGSTDESTQIARGYARDHPGRIRYLAHEGRQNRGASASRNLGAQHATGEYLAFLDADDVYLPRKLESQVPVLDAHPEVGMIYAATEYWYGWSGRHEDARRDWTWRKYGAPTGSVIPPPRMLTTFLRDGGTVPCMGSVLARRSAVEGVGGWEESFRYICTDQVFHAKMCLTWPVLIVDGCWDKYRQHEDSSCQVVARAGQTDAAFRTYLQWLETYLRAQRVDDPQLWSALRSALRPYRHPYLHRAGRHAAGLVHRLHMTAARAIPPALRRRLPRRWS
jgi:glycosyltransferase involved in cell wall biosynthesis